MKIDDNVHFAFYGSGWQAAPRRAHAETAPRLGEPTGSRSEIMLALSLSATLAFICGLLTAWLIA